MIREKLRIVRNNVTLIRLLGICHGERRLGRMLGLLGYLPITRRLVCWGLVSGDFIKSVS